MKVLGIIVSLVLILSTFKTIQAQVEVGTLVGVPGNCVIEVESWSTLVEVQPNRFKLSVVEISIPEGKGDCFYRYGIKHPYLSGFFTSTVQIACAKDDKIECFGTITEDMTLSFYIDGEPGELSGTLAEDWVLEEYYSWLVRGWRVFIPYILG